MTNIQKDAAKSRRAFLKGGAPPPQVPRRSPCRMWRGPRTPWCSSSRAPGPPRISSTNIAADFVTRVNDMGGGRLKLDLLAAGAVAKAFEVQDAVIAGTLDGGHGVAPIGTASTRPTRCSARRPPGAGAPTR